MRIYYVIYYLFILIHYSIYFINLGGSIWRCFLLVICDASRLYIRVYSSSYCLNKRSQYSTNSRCMRITRHLCFWEVLVRGKPRFEVTTPHPLSGDPIQILPEAYLAHFT